MLPVGISFYTFQTISYAVDVYREEIKPVKSILDFGFYVSFFPQLVAGPIVRAADFIPQLYKPYQLSNYNFGLALFWILKGLTKKVIIGDYIAVNFIDRIFDNPLMFTGFENLMALYGYSLQVYADFSGYTDIAIGIALLMGFTLPKNFDSPYKAKNVGEFWRRWHISLSTWFRDYVYIPLGGSRGGIWMKVRNTFIIFIVSGFWHGANWTFIIWGALNAIYFLPLLLRGNNRNNMGVVAQNSYLPSFKELLQILVTFGITVLAWIFFRADNVTHAFEIISEIFSKSLFSIPDFANRHKAFYLLPIVAIFILFEWMGRREDFALSQIEHKWKRPVRHAVYYLILIAIVIYSGKEQQFIYFQF